MYRMPAQRWQFVDEGFCVLEAVLAPPQSALGLAIAIPI
jgi:hypothetical protein